MLEREDLTNFDWYENLLSIAEKTLAEYAALLNYKNTKEFIQFMNYWWFETNLDDFPTYPATNSTDIYWSKLNTNPPFKDFSYICMRLSSIGISEAEVERLFSIHKSMLNRSVTNLGTETLHNRCILHLSQENCEDNI